MLGVAFIETRRQSRPRESSRGAGWRVLDTEDLSRPPCWLSW